MKLSSNWSLALTGAGWCAERGVDRYRVEERDGYVAVTIRWWSLGWIELRHVTRVPANVDVIGRPPREVRLRAGGSR